MSAEDRCISMQYRDPITREHRSTVLCPRHRRNALHVLRLLTTGSRSTDAGSLHSCDACANEAGVTGGVASLTLGGDNS